MTEVYITAMQVLIMLLLLIVGAVCYKTRIVGNEGIKNLTDIALYVATSAVIIEAFMTEYNPELIKSLLMVAGLSCLAHLISIALAILVFKKKDGYETLRFAAVFGNCGFMGIPLVVALVPENGALLASVYMVVFNIFNWTYGVVLYNGKAEKGSLKKLLLSPVIISIIIGFIIFVFRIKLPSPVATTVSYLADLFTPLAMLVTGALIAKSNLLAAFKRGSTYLVLFLKLILTSFIMILIMRFLPIPEEVKMTVILLAAVPSASNTVMFSSKYNKNYEMAGELVVVSNVISIITIPLMVYLGGLI